MPTTDHESNDLAGAARLAADDRFDDRRAVGAPSNVEPLDLVAVAEWLKGLTGTLEARHQADNNARLECPGYMPRRNELDKAEIVSGSLASAVRIASDAVGRAAER